MKKFFKYLLYLILLAAIAGTAFYNLWPSFGGSVAGARLARAEASPSFGDGNFVNKVPQSPTKASEMWMMAKRQFGGDEQRIPPLPLPVMMLKPDDFPEPEKDALKAIWLGHATVYLEVDGLRILLDPVFSEYASPVQGIGPKRLHPVPVTLENLPKIDAVMISHDHYDHLDMATVQHLAATGSHFYVPLGIGTHLERWKVPADQFTEMEWGDEAKRGPLRIVCTEARHYSGRGLFNLKKTLWSSWSIIGPSHRVYYSGDTGFSDHFKRIGEQYGPFDLAAIKVGAYGPSNAWIDIHMGVKDAVRAHIDIGAKQMLPVHWATFNLAFHDWDEPIRIAAAEAVSNNVDLLTPKLGEPVIIGQQFNSATWWDLK